jgi:hypothetical protein
MNPKKPKVARMTCVTKRTLPQGTNSDPGIMVVGVILKDPRTAVIASSAIANPR